MQYLLPAGAAILGYILGSVDFAIIITKCFLRDDVRAHGSGNAGTANVARVFGAGVGLATLLGDVVKTALAMYIGALMWGVDGACIAGAACLLGHCFPVFFNFRGGKGVAASAGVALMLDWRLALTLIALYVISAAVFRIASVASLTGTTLLPFMMLLFDMGFGVHFAPAQYALAAFASILVLIMHRANIKRLLHGEEGKFSFGKKKD